MEEPSTLVGRLVIAWAVWLACLSGLVAWRGSSIAPVAILGALSLLWIAYFLLKLRSSLFRSYLTDWFLLLSPTSFLVRPMCWVLCRTVPSAPTAYSPNLANTIITLMTAIVVVPILYGITWNPELNHHIITLERDTVKQVYFPSFTLFQRADWTSQANLQATVQPKCFLGWHDENAEACGSTNTSLPQACQCTDSWGDRIRDFEWQNTRYRSLRFQASSDMVSASPAIQMITQNFFSYDTKKSLSDSSRILSPSLYIAVHDPTFTIEEALAAGYTRMVLINANGMTAINLGLERREAAPGHARPAYDYQLTISTIPSTTLQCDTAASCFLTLVFQFPSFERQVLSWDVKLKWDDVASLAGSWFALFQLVGWILSGAAWYV